MRSVLNGLMRIFKHTLSINFWLVISFTICLGVIIGWLLSGFLIKYNIIDKYKALPEIVKNFASAEDIWIEVLLSTSIPMFLLFSLQFHSLKVNIPFDVRYYLFRALPYIKYFKWLSRKPTVFVVFTASIVLGCVFYIGFLGSLKYFLALIVPAIIYTFAIMLHITTSDILGGSKISNFAYKNNHAIGNICLAITALMWLYLGIIKPYQDFSLIFNFLV